MMTLFSEIFKFDFSNDLNLNVFIENMLVGGAHYFNDNTSVTKKYKNLTDADKKSIKALIKAADRTKELQAKVDYLQAGIDKWNSQLLVQLCGLDVVVREHKYNTNVYDPTGTVLSPRTTAAYNSAVPSSIQHWRITMTTKAPYDKLAATLDKLLGLHSESVRHSNRPACTTDILKVACDNRVVEGEFINRELQTIRRVAQDMVNDRLASVNSIVKAPLYKSFCEASYCDTNTIDCWNPISRGRRASSEIFSWAQNVTGIDGFTNQVVLAIFCVVNLSRSTNDPPSIPFVDINPLRKSLRADRFNNAYTTVPTKFKEIYDRLTQSPDVFADLIEITNPLLTAIEGPGWYVQNKGGIHDVIDRIEASNSMTTMGTLEFTDRMAKQDLTDNVVCSVSNDSSPEYVSLVDADGTALRLDNMRTH
jgi:hypothetical protein